MNRNIILVIAILLLAIFGVVVVRNSDSGKSLEQWKKDCKANGGKVEETVNEYLCSYVNGDIFDRRKK